MTARVASIWCAAAIAGAAGQFATAAGAETVIEDTSAGRIAVETVASGLESPWALAFLPDGNMLVTERPGRIRLVAPDGTVSAPLEGAPRTQEWGQGGMLDVALDPDFASNGLVYLTFSEIEGENARTAVMRARLAGSGMERRLEDGEVIFRMNRFGGSSIHFGSRLAFAPDGTLFVTVGERGDGKRAQDPMDHGGKVIRINPDGSVPADNPHAGGGGLPEIWSIGHRNPQGAAINPATGGLWTAEHGPRGGDEINIPQAGLNYGWPVITHGRDYSGDPVGSGASEAPGMEQPVHHWVPSVSPSGMAFYTGEAIEPWQGSLFVGALSAMALIRLELDGDRVVDEERLLTGLEERIRDVRQGPDGYLYLLTDSPEGRILRLGPAD